MGEIEIGSYVKYLRSDSKVDPESLFRIEDIIFQDSPFIKNIIVLSDWARDTDNIFGEFTYSKIYNWIYSDLRLILIYERLDVSESIDFFESLYRNRSFFFRGA